MVRNASSARPCNWTRTATAFVGENSNVIVLNNNKQIISKIKRAIGVVDDDFTCDKCMKRKQLVGGEDEEKKDDEVGDDKDSSGDDTVAEGAEAGDEPTAAS